MQAQARNGTLELSPQLLEDIRKNNGARYEVTRLTPDSKQARGFLFGGVYALWAFLNGMDYKDHAIIDYFHEQGKKEFNGEMVIRDGKKTIMGKSTKGQRREYTEKVIQYLEENYAINRTEVLEPEKYKYWRDVIFPTGECDHYIDYLLSIGTLQLP